MNKEQSQNAKRAPNRATLGIKLSTKNKLDKNRAPGQCYDGFICQMIELWEEVNGSRFNKPGVHTDNGNI
ncbi:MAG: hypothetical protein PHQ10_03285 [Dehalococcoidales bacterium]|jgi:hypothetical protein|nr:hypothetical protein [Dehalococcoidales bacterium]MDD3264374.1 hypothetical protein [Dehalococcoidales bacterium]MDD4322140.1 hypothetical protein [Dehalococcoidales bacterium]MDD4793710.1 hypothetical protein [Dehalococcoidales bacterium]MDD5497957.1 hypothetical protein [Dehalococcoidales bacterium]